MSQQAKAQSNRRLIGIICAVLAVALIGFVVFYTMQRSNTTALSSGPQTPPNVNSDGSGIVANPGKAKAGVPTLVMYEDYQCPPCGQAATLLGPAIKALGDKGEIRVEYRTMTFLDRGQANGPSKRAAIAAACADTQGALQSYHAALFANQASKYPDATLRNILPKDAGLTGRKLTAFQNCYDKQLTAGFVDAVYQKAGQAGVNSTPTYLVNGKQLNLQTVQPTEDGLRTAITALAKGN